MEQKIRGSVLLAYMDFIRLKWGNLAFQKCLEDIEYHTAIKPGEYYDNEVRELILKWITDEKGKDYARDLGRFVVKNLGLLAWIVRFANPKIIAKKFPDNYSEVYTFGRVEVETEDRNVIVIRLYDVNTIEESCLSWHGVCEGVLDLTKTTGTVTKNTCQLDGADFCEYEIEYSG
ncbi:MAG: hypothetical protein AYK23_02105 [Candidatus Proteinoplasmatales archaeon SG8-5]|nr:MAG: hypothetical protein AYK23_02105 [Candidatus Proteinoplasmatales archaeon SG8-5]